MIKNESCVIYLRESCHAQWKEGLECQTQKLFDYCRKNHCPAIAKFVASGSCSESIEVLKRAVDFAKKNGLCTILITSVDRIAGTSVEFSDVYEMIREARVYVASIDGSYESWLKVHEFEYFDT